jgi:hypothetical protein
MDAAGVSPELTLSNIHCMRAGRSYLSFLLLSAALLGWRAFYSEVGTTWIGVGCLAVVALISLTGGYRIALGRRQAFLNAALEPGSSLSKLLTGRIGAAVAAILGTAASLPVAAYLLLTGLWVEVALAFAGAAWVVAMVLLFDRLWLDQLRPRYGMSIISSVAIGVSAVPAIGLAMAFYYFVLPVPDFARTDELREALALGVAEFPRHHPWVFEVMSAIRSVDAFVYWVLDKNGYQAALPLTLFLLKSAITYVSVVKLAADWQAAFMTRRH